MLRSVPNDSQLFGGNGITEAQLREIDEKPDIQAIKDAEREQARAEREAQGLPPLEENDAIEPDEEEEALLNPDDSILILTGANASGKPFPPTSASTDTDELFRQICLPQDRRTDRLHGTIVLPFIQQSKLT